MITCHIPTPFVEWVAVEDATARLLSYFTPHTRGAIRISASMCEKMLPRAGFSNRINIGWNKIAAVIIFVTIITTAVIIGASPISRVNSNRAINFGGRKARVCRGQWPWGFDFPLVG